MHCAKKVTTVVVYDFEGFEEGKQSYTVCWYGVRIAGSQVYYSCTSNLNAQWS